MQVEGAGGTRHEACGGRYAVGGERSEESGVRSQAPAGGLPFVKMFFIYRLICLYKSLIGIKFVHKLLIIAVWKEVHIYFLS